MHAYRSHTCADLNKSHAGQTVRLSGWVHRVRDHGGVLFIDLRDHYGITQVVADPDSSAFKTAERVRSEFIQLAEAFPGDLPLQLRVGRSLLAAGDVDDAARVFRRVTERFADPGSAFADLADAALARHEYIAAFEAATRALARNPADKASAERRTLAAAVLALDPTQPRLSAGERTKRLGRLLGAARERLVACDGATPASADSDVMPMLDRWLASSRGQQLEEADLGMALLGAASRRVAERCPPGTAPDAVDLVLRGAVRSSRP